MIRHEIFDALASHEFWQSPTSEVHGQLPDFLKISLRSVASLGRGRDLRIGLPAGFQRAGHQARSFHFLHKLPQETGGNGTTRRSANRLFDFHESTGEDPKIRMRPSETNEWLPNTGGGLKVVDEQLFEGGCGGRLAHELRLLQRARQK